MKRKYLLLGIDLFWVAASPFIALFIRDNFAPRPEAFEAATQYAIVGLLIGVLVLPLAGVNRTLWRYTSLPDLMRLVMSVTAIVLLSMFLVFAFSRLEDIARSLPAIQWMVLLAVLAGSRLTIRIWRERRREAGEHLVEGGDTQNVLIVGVNQIAELYLRSVAEFAPGHFSVVGILAQGTHLPGRILRSHKVLGHPEDLPQVVRQFEVHGAPVDRVIVVEPATRLSATALEALLNLERASTVKVEWIVELLGFGSGQGCKEEESPVLQSSGLNRIVNGAVDLPIGRYHGVKRVLDFVGAATVTVLLMPLFGILGALVAFDVGLPIVFWQRRPGRHGRAFKLYKFRTMRGAHDREGRRIPDQERSSRLANWLRRTRLDELPQLYNIIVGEMSFVGPRPLLPCDQPDDMLARLEVRPGLTGFAQVYGDRTMAANDKNLLDLWYVRNASIWLDVKVVLRTVLLFARGERLDTKMLEMARKTIERLSGQEKVGQLTRDGVTRTGRG